MNELLSFGFVNSSTEGTSTNYRMDYRISIIQDCRVLYSSDDVVESWSQAYTNLNRICILKDKKVSYIKR